MRFTAGWRLDPGESSDNPARERSGAALAGVSAASGLVLVALGGTTVLRPFGWYLISSVATAILVVTFRIERALVAAVVLGVVLFTLDLSTRSDLEEPFHHVHDGAVLATEEAASLVVAGQNPYEADMTEALAPDHHTLRALRSDMPNPLVEHYPYLPMTFMVQVPLVEAGDALGGAYDPRMLYVGITVLALWLVGTGTPPSWRRGASLLAILANGAVAVYSSWGANDSAAASLVVAATLIARRRPVLAGVLLAFAVSLKAVLVVAIVPLAVLWFVTDRTRLRRVMVSAAATGALTCLPFLLLSPEDFIEDTVLYNIGATDLAYPPSGLGLGAAFPGVVSGGRLLALSGLLVLGASALAIWWVRRRPEGEVALFAAGVIVVAGFFPARTFQLSYVPLMVILWGPIWRLPLSSWWPFAQPARRPSGSL